jgi:hypothetical protein
MGDSEKIAATGLDDGDGRLQRIWKNAEALKAAKNQAEGG